MTSSPFIEFGTHPGTIINVSQIVSIEQTAVSISGKKRKRYDVLGATAVLVHTINIFLNGRGAIELVFDSEAMCTATLKMLKMALTPMTIKKPGIANRMPSRMSIVIPRPLPPNEAAKPAPTPPAAKPPRKPYTRRK